MENGFNQSLTANIGQRIDKRGQLILAPEFGDKGSVAGPAGDEAESCRCDDAQIGLEEESIQAGAEAMGIVQPCLGIFREYCWSGSKDLPCAEDHLKVGEVMGSQAEVSDPSFETIS